MGKNAWPKGDLEHSHPVNYDTITIQVALKRNKKAHCIINETYYVSLVTVLFRSIRPSRVTRQVVLDEIGCLSCVTRRVVGFEKPLAKWSPKKPIF
jgi:hypothetical protein